MSISRKAISAGLSAALLASLVATVAAPAAFASTSVTSAGVVPRDGTSANAATFTFTENAKDAFPAGGGTLIVTITDSAGGSTVHFSGTGTLTAPDSLGASLSVGDNSFTVTATASDINNIEQITVSGLKISADIGAALGAIKANLTGTLAPDVLAATATATGVLQATLGTAAATVSVNVTSACGFDATNTNGQANFSDTSDARDITADAGGATGLQNIGFAAGSAVHNIGATVSQTVANCVTSLASPGTVADVVVQNANSPTSVNPGEQNQEAANTWISEQSAGYIAAGTLTFTLSPAGVLFSASPTVTVTAGDLALGSNVCNLSFDRTSCSVAVSSASSVASTVTLSNVLLDVASTVANGTAVKVTVTASPAINVDVKANTIAYVSRVIVGVAAQPTIFINYNDQSTGLITLKEAGAGFFQSGTGSNNTFGLCIESGESFTRAPYAVVTAGDLKLLDTSTHAGSASVLGSLYNVDGFSCAYWTVYSASTAASTIEIRGSDASGAVLPTGALNGPRLSVPPSLAPGTTQMAILVGLHDDVLAFDSDVFSSLVSNAVRAFKSGVVVTALSQPVIPAGSTGSAAGNITIAETLNGQFKAGERICVAIQPRVSNFYNQDTWFKQATTNDLPVLSTNADSGLLVGGIAMGNSSGCSHAYADTRSYFSFPVTQQSFGALGTITISNINYITAADAPAGPVLVDVNGATSSNGVEFESVVSNARIGTVAKSFLDASIAKGVTTSGPFTLNTVVTTKGSYVTVKITTSPAMAGAHVGIYIAKKVNGVWTKFSPHTGRLANGSGVVYYYYKAGSKVTLAIRGYFSGTQLQAPAWSNAVRVVFK